MPAKVHRLRRSASPARSAERRKLAAAIERHEAARSKLSKLRDAIERAGKERLAAFRAAEKADAALAEAKANESAALAAAFIDKIDIASPVDVATAAATKAAARRAHMRQVDAALEKEAKETEYELGWAKSNLDDAVRAVFRSSVPAARLLEEAKALQAELVDRRAALRYLHRGRFIGEPDEAAVRRFLSHNADELPGTTGSVEFENYDDRPAVGPWRAAREALETDADASLPS